MYEIANFNWYLLEQHELAIKLWNYEFQHEATLLKCMAADFGSASSSSQSFAY